MKNKKTKQSKLKDSKNRLSPKLLQTLKKVIIDEGGVITYVFCEDRIDLKTGSDYQKKSFLHTKLGQSALFKVDKSNRKTPKSFFEIMEMFESTKEDLGAAYYIIG